MFAVAANDPLPYRPIRIIDVSPIHSSLRARPAGTRTGRRRRAGIAAVIAVVLAVAAVSVGAGAAPATTSVAGEFRLGPGHAMPADLGPR